MRDAVHEVVDNRVELDHTEIIATTILQLAVFRWKRWI